MAALSEIFNPVRLPADEKVILRKRESLRTQGIGWMASLLWVFTLACAGVTLLAVKFGGQAAAGALANGVMIVLAFLLLPATLYTFLSWQAGTYHLDQSEIRLADTLAARLLLMRPVALDLRQIAGVEVARPIWPGSMFNLGDVIVWDSNRSKVLVLKGVERPQLVMEEIKRRIRLAHARAKAGQEGTPDPAAPLLEIRRSGAWLLLKWLPLAAFLWGTAVSWYLLQVSSETALPTLFAAFEVVSLGSLVLLVPWWIISFLRWWFRIWVVTDRRVIQREGLLNITSSVLSLDNVVTATAVTTGLGRFVDVGHVQIMTAGLSGDVHMRNVSAPDYVRHLVLETQEQMRRQRQQIEAGEINKRLRATLRL